ncbi:hypothetical protein [Rhodopirellula islandica]|nr:hypothetical protein [Rhodopirellula islandica]
MSIIRHCGERPEGELRDQIFKAWWQANSEHCGTGEETSWLEFDQMLDELRGDGFLMVVHSILPNIEVPFWADHLRLRQIGREVARIVVACDSVSKCQPFHLSPRTIQKMIGCADHTTPYRNLRTLERKGIIEAIQRGEAKPGGKATTYRLLVNLDGSMRPHKQPASPNNPGPTRGGS